MKIVKFLIIVWSIFSFNTLYAASYTAPSLTGSMYFSSAFVDQSGTNELVINTQITQGIQNPIGWIYASNVLTSDPDVYNYWYQGSSDSGLTMLDFLDSQAITPKYSFYRMTGKYKYKMAFLLVTMRGEMYLQLSTELDLTSTVPVGATVATFSDPIIPMGSVWDYVYNDKFEFDPNDVIPLLAAEGIYDADDYQPSAIDPGTGTDDTPYSQSDIDTTEAVAQAELLVKIEADPADYGVSTATFNQTNLGLLFKNLFIGNDTYVNTDFDFWVNQNDPSGLYWKLKSATTTSLNDNGVTGSTFSDKSDATDDTPYDQSDKDAAKAAAELELLTAVRADPDTYDISTATFNLDSAGIFFENVFIGNGNYIKVFLDLWSNPDDPAGLYWKLDLSTLNVTTTP